MKDEVEKLLMRKDNALQYTDTLLGKQTLRDDLWAVSTEEIESIVQLFQKAQVEAVRAELETLKNDISGIGSKGDKVNGDSKFMLGVRAVEREIKDRLARLRKDAL